MALVKCRECSKEISDQAITCPNCGAPLKAVQPVRVAKQGIGCGGLIVASALALILLAMWGAFRPRDRTAELVAKEDAIRGAPAPDLTPPAAPGKFRVVGSQGVFRMVVAADAATADDIRTAAVDLCGRESICKVYFWANAGSAATAVPMSDAQVASRIAAWDMNSNTGFREFKWDCKRFPQPYPEDCL